MKTWLTMMVIATLLVAISMAGIKKGDIQTDTTSIVNVRLPDFIIVNNIFNSVVSGSGGSIRWVGRTVTENTTFLRTDINVSEEGDVIVQSFQDVYQRNVITTDYYVAYDPPPPPPAGDPLIIDLDQNSVPDVSGGINIVKNSFDKSRAKLFDLNADGINDFVEWIGPNDGLIIFFENGKIKENVNGFNLMSNAFGYKNGFEKLSENFDFNKDNKISGEELDNLYVWVDKNQDAKVQKNELLTFKELKIVEIGTVYGENRMEGYAKNTDGNIIKIWQWWPSVEWGISKK